MTGPSEPAPAPAPGPPLVVDRLTIRYGPRTAVDGLRFRVEPGEIYGLLGANGAGKSSTLKALVGLRRPEEGTVRIFGRDPFSDPIEVKRIIGYVPESALLFDALSPREFLEFVGNIRRLPPELATDRLARYARALELERELDRPLATLSSGTRQKTLLLAALLHQPPLLILDEPLTNLDPRAIRIMKEMLAAYVRAGPRGVLLSTHTMEVAETLCHRVGILDQGRLRAEGNLEGLRRDSGQPAGSLEEVYLRLTRSETAIREAVRDLGGA